MFFLGGRDLSVSPLLIDSSGGSDFTLLTNPISPEWTFSAVAGIAPLVDDDLMQPISISHFRREGTLSTNADMNPGSPRPYVIKGVSHSNPNGPIQMTVLRGTRSLSRTGSIQGQWTVINSLRSAAGEVPIVLASGYHDSEPGIHSPADLPYASFLLGSYEAPELQGPTLTFSRSNSLSYDDSRFKVQWSLDDWEIPYSSE